MHKRSWREFSVGEIDRVIEMAWEDRTSFDAIQDQFGLTQGEVIELMRSELKPDSFRLWRKRVAGRRTKHVEKRGFLVGRFRCPDTPRPRR
ncbi:TIGR03643 family protein [Pirellulaceae bacterium SH501]